MKIIPFQNICQMFGFDSFLKYFIFILSNFFFILFCSILFYMFRHASKLFHTNLHFFVFLKKKCLSFTNFFREIKKQTILYSKFTILEIAEKFFKKFFYGKIENFITEKHFIL